MRCWGWTVLLILTAAVLFAAAPAFANGYDEYPPPIAWAPSGRMLAAVVGSELWIVKPEGFADSIASGAVSSPSWSDDGKYVAYIGDGAVFIYDLLKKTTDNVETSAPPLDCAFSRGKPGADVLYCSTGDRFYGADIVAYSVESGQTNWLFESTEITECTPVPGPDGGSLLYLSQGGETPGGYEQLCCWSEKKGGRALTGKKEFGEYGYHESNAVWLDDTHVIFQRGGWDEWKLYELDTVSGDESLVAENAHRASVSRTMGVLAFERTNYDQSVSGDDATESPSTIWIKYLDSGNEYQISPVNMNAHWPAVSVDGTHVAWLEDGEMGPQVVIRTVVNAVG